LPTSPSPSRIQATGLGLVALPALPAVAHSLSGTPAQAQSSLAVFLAGMAAGQFIYGPASDRIGRRIPLLFGAMVFVMGSAMCAMAPNMEWLIVARFFQALGGSAGGVVSRAVVRDKFDHTETARTLSLLMLIMGLAPILAPLFGGWILSVANWRWIFWFQSIFGVVTALATFVMLAESRSEVTALQARSENPVQAVVTLLKSRRLLGYAVAGALNGAALFTYISASPGLIISTYGFSPQAFGWIFGINAVAVIGANQINRWLLKRMTPDKVLARASLISCGLASVLAIGAISGFGGKWGVLVPLFFTLGTYSLMQGNTSAGALSVDPKRAGSISALMGTLSFGSGALGSAFAAHLADGSARPMAVIITLAMFGSTAFLHLLALKPDRSQASI